MRVIKWLRAFLDEEDAPTMFEYALLVAFIALVVVAAATLLGTSISTLFQDTATSF